MGGCGFGGDGCSLCAAVVVREHVLMRFWRGGGMVTRVGAKLLHIAPPTRLLGDADR